MAAKRLTKRQFNVLVRQYKDRLPGGLGDKRRPDQFDQDQLYRGVLVELEHTSDPMLAMEIAVDHLTEHSRYYDYLEDMERKMKSSPNPVNRRSRKPKLMPITKEQEQALRDYAQWAGKRWKEDLAMDWMRGGSTWPGSYALLHQLRNSHGPAWLNQFTFEGEAKPAPKKRTTKKRTAGRKPNPCGCDVAINPTPRSNPVRGRSRDETDAIIDRIVVDEDFKRAIPPGEWGSVKNALTVLVGNELDFLTGVFVGGVKKQDLSSFYVDDRVKVKMVESNYSLGKVGKGALKKAVASLQKSFAKPNPVRASKSKRTKKSDTFSCPTKPVVKPGKLSAATRRAIPKNLFLLPATKDLPVHDYNHTMAAIGRLQMMWNQGHLTPQQYREAFRNLQDACNCFGIDLQIEPAVPMGGKAAMAKKTSKRKAKKTSKRKAKKTTTKAKKTSKRKAKKTTTKAKKTSKRKVKKATTTKAKKTTKRKVKKATTTKAKKTSKRKVKKATTTKAKKTSKRKVKKAAPKKTTKRKTSKKRVSTVVKKSKGVSVLDSRLKSRLTAVEGKNWAKRHDESSAHSPEMNRRAYEIIRDEKQVGKVMLADLKGGLGVIRGTGQTKYIVDDKTGEVSLVGATADAAKQARARKAGFNVV